jgi:glycosyl transferase family 1
MRVREDGQTVIAPQIADGSAARPGPLRVTALMDRYVPFANAGGEWALHWMLAPLAAAGHHVRVVSALFPRGTAAPHVVDGVEVWPATATERVLADTDVMVSQLGATRDACNASARLQVPLVYLFHNDLTVATWGLTPRDVTGVVYNAAWIREAVIHGDERWAYAPGVVVRPPAPMAAYELPDGPDPFDRERITLVNPIPAKGAELFYELAWSRRRDLFLAVEGGYGSGLRPRPARHKNVEWQPNTPRMRDDVYARTRVLLVPSVYESWGRVAGEAMAAGIPVIANRTPGLVECLGSAGLFADLRRPHEWHALLDRLRDDRCFYDEVSAAGLARARGLAARSLVELAGFEALLRVAANAERTVVRSRPMPRYDPFRGKSSRRRPIRVDVSETANGHREAAERLDVPDGDGELARLEALGVTDPPSVDFARRMDGAVIERAVQGLGHEVTPGVASKILTALDTGAGPLVPQEIQSEPVFMGAVSLPGGGELVGFQAPADGTPVEVELVGDMSGEFVQMEGGTLDLEVDGGPPSDELARDFAETFAQQVPIDTPHEGNGDDGEKGGGDAGATGDGAPSHDEGHPSPEPEPATTGDTAGSGAASDPAVLSAAAAALVDQVPAKATGYQGVVDWLKEPGLSAAQRYDRAEAAEWVEKQREAGQRKAVLAAVKPILYDD